MSNKGDEIQPSLFGDSDDLASWQQHWQGMPEYKSKNLMPFKQIIVSFESQKDIDDFARLIGQKITSRTDSIWFPKMDIERLNHLRYKKTKNE